MNESITEHTHIINEPTANRNVVGKPKTVITPKLYVFCILAEKKMYLILGLVGLLITCLAQ